jgi:hypothetical protein
VTARAHGACQSRFRRYAIAVTAELTQEPEPSQRKWRPPPWFGSIPSGRKPSWRHRFIEVVPYWATLMALYSWNLAWAPWGLISGWVLAPSVIAAILGVGYGALMIATARRPTLKPVWFFPGFASTSAAARWYGLAFVLAQGAAWGVAIVVHVMFGDLRPESVPMIPFGPLSVLLAFTACMVLARRAANRPIKRAILTGLAPSYVLAQGQPYWWDGEHWQSLESTVPESSLRSPDGHYWWTGSDWFRMPPNRRSEDLRPRTLPYLGA